MAPGGTSSSSRGRSPGVAIYSGAITDPTKRAPLMRGPSPARAGKPWEDTPTSTGT